MKKGGKYTNKKPLIVVSICAVVLLVLSSLSNVVGYQSQNIKNQSLASRGIWLYVGGSGPGNYTRIQDAINASSDGDTVFVFSGTYPGHVHINKSISLIGENKNTTIIEGGWGSLVYISSSLVLVTGFMIRDCGWYESYAVHSYRDHTTIIGNILTKNIIGGIGVFSSYNLIANNSFIDNPGGVVIGGDHNIVTENIFESNKYDGVDVIWRHPEIPLPSSDNSILGNIFNNNGGGIDISYGNNTLISSNIITNNSCGIYASYVCTNYSTNNTTIENNTIVNNNYGIVFHNVNNSCVYHNFFKNIVYQASDDNYLGGMNNWDNGYPDGGNFWSNYTGSDDYSGPHQDIPGSDGIGDIPYEIIGFGGIDSKDRYPLMYPFGPYPDFSVCSHGGFGISIDITNTGDRDATDFGWNVTVTGGVFGFVNLSENGSLDTLKIAETFPITVTPFGIGTFTIVIVVDALNAKNQIFKGHGFLVVSMVFPILKPIVTPR